ncbi:MAG: hypothetical protein ACO3AY_05070 [Chitinophagaceae bacterium]
MGENTYLMDKKPWETPIITEVNVKKIREEEMENYLRLINNEELFLRISGSDGP